MTGRIKSSSKQSETAVTVPDAEDQEEIAVVRPQAPAASQLIGGSGVSLDGRSLVLPTDREMMDDVSSINTYDYVYKGEMRIIGTADNYDEDEYSCNKARSAMQSGEYEHKKNYEYHSAKPPSTEGLEDDDEERGCLPLWITEAPTWLKMVIILSTALLVGAIVLIGVGAALAVQQQDQASKQVNNNFPGFSPPSAPTTPSNPPNPSAPTATPPTEGNQNVKPATFPVSSPTKPSDSKPTSPNTVTAAPDGAPSPPTLEPSSAPTSSTVTFYATGGRFTGDALSALPGELRNLPYWDANTVMFHLGDWNSPYATSCVESSYVANVALYNQSNVPVYFVPGDNEFNDCPDPTQALSFWHEYILDFETKYWPAPKAWNITRQTPNYPENFSFLYNRLLFVGINLVGGQVQDSNEWKQRHQADLDWIDENFNNNQGSFEVLVILAHADPDIQANANFFTTFYDRVANDYTDIQVIFLHRNLGVEPWGLEGTYNDIQNLMVVVVEGSVWPPMLVKIDAGAGVVDIEQEGWYNNYMLTKDGK